MGNNGDVNTVTSNFLVNINGDRQSTIPVISAADVVPSITRECLLKAVKSFCSSKTPLLSASSKRNEKSIKALRYDGSAVKKGGDVGSSGLFNDSFASGLEALSSAIRRSESFMMRLVSIPFLLILPWPLGMLPSTVAALFSIAEGLDPWKE
jgi:hypothetical protein